MSPPTRQPGQSPQGQSSANDEAKRREQAAMMAMMDDLGLARVEELPLDEGGRNRDRGHDRRVRGGGDVRMPLPAPPALQVVQRAPPRGNAGASSWSFGQAWADAIASGAFDDDDAEGVKGLDDLGGGRIYDRAANTTMRILDQRSKRTGHHVEYPMPKKTARPNDSGANNIHDRMVAARRQAANQARPPSSQASASSAKSKKTKPPRLTPTSRPARRLPPPPRDVPALGVPVPDLVVDLSTPLPYEPENTILRIPVRFSSRDITPAQPALIVLSSAKKPELGFFTVFVYNRPFCQWPISAWHDYATGVDHLLGVTFQDTGSFHGYELYFANDNDLREFMSRVRALMAGDYLDQADSAAPPASAPQSAPVSNSTAAAAPVAACTPTIASSIGNPGPQNRLPHPPASRDVAPSTQMKNGAASSLQPVAERAHSPVLNDTSRSAKANANAPSHNTTISSSIQESSQVEPIGEPEQENPLEFEPNNTSTVTSQVGSEDAGFLFREDAMVMARTVFSVMFARYTGTMTAEEWDKVAEGIRAGVMEHMVKNARERGFSDQRIQALRDTVNEALDTEIKVNRRSRQGVTNGDVGPQPRVNGTAQPEPPATAASTRAGRIQYSAEELLSLRHAAADPSDRLANIPYLPRPGERPPQPDTPPRRPGSPAGPAISQTQVLKSAGAMDWVLGKANAQPTSEPSSSTQTPSAAASNTARPSAPRDVGLQSSRWATGTSELKAANAFTGPKYERAWSKRSYLEDLAQLDPQTRVTAAAEDLMDLYFPMPNGGPLEPQTSADQDTQEPAVAGAESGAATPTRSDKIENLRLGISRLSIWSPTFAPQRPTWAPAPVQPSSPVIQASRDLWAQTTSTGLAQQASVPAAPPTQTTSAVSTHSANTPVAQAIATSSQPGSSTSAWPEGMSSAVRPQVAPPQSVPMVSAQSMAAPTQARMTSMHAAPSSPLAPSVDLASAGSARVAPLQSTSGFATQSTTSPGQVRMTSVHAAPSSVPAYSTLASARPTQVASSQNMSTAVTPQPRTVSLSAAPSSVPTQCSALTGVLSPRMVQPQATTVTAPQPGPQAAQPKPRGLAASRHASGDGPSSSGNFKFVVPK